MPDMETQSFAGFAEPLSAWGHLAGSAVFAVLAFFLIRRGWGDRRRVALLATFAASAVILLAISGVYHTLSLDSAARAVMKRIDHAAIFVLITGTLTPIYGILFRGRHRWGALGGLWAVTVAALVLKTVLFAAVPAWLGMAAYMTLGWFGIVPAAVLWRRWGFRFVAPLIWGGLAYTLGALPMGPDRPVIIPGVFGPHELFHIGVLLGVAFHWRFIHGFAPLSLDRRVQDASLAV